MKVRYVISMEIFLEGKNLEEIEEKFFVLDLGRLAEAQKKKEIGRYDYRDTEARYLITDDDRVGEEI